MAAPYLYNMKQKNFPAKKNARQMRAFQRLVDQYNVETAAEVVDDHKVKRILKQREIVSAKLQSPESARAKRTKRSGAGSGKRH